ncbi:MAG: CD225/dispanin family protein [Pyrinomonadaceae bacterium]
MTYYIYKDDERSGPFEDSDVQERLRTGQLSSDDLGCGEGMKDWKRLALLFPLAVPDYEKASIDGIPTHLVGSVISLLFCLIPGIIAVVYAVGTRNAKKQFDAEKAVASERLAMRWMIAAYLIGVIGIVLRLLGSR